MRPPWQTIKMANVWKVNDAPKVDITEWRIFRISGNNNNLTTDHVVGFNSRYQEGRVSSPIQAIVNSETQIVKTRSGRLYQLLGNSGINDDANYVWEIWLNLNKVTKEQISDVSDEYKIKFGELGN